MPGHDIMLIGTSAGGVEALSELARRLPADLPAALFVVHHFPAHSTSVLPSILNRKGPLRAAHAVDGEAIQHGRIYVSPPDQHLLLSRGRMRLARGPRENGHRPAIDPLFRSAARSYGPRAVGVVLTGTLDDGTAGLLAIKQRGGVAVVQDPSDALYPGMPRSAVENVAVDYVAPLPELAPILERLAYEAAVDEGGRPVSEEMDSESEIAAFDLDAIEDPDRPGKPSGFGCPECGGALWELEEGGLIRFRCRVGHALSPDTLLAEQTVALETALWTALRALEESAALARRLMERARQRGHKHGAERFMQQLHDKERRASLIREVLVNSPLFEEESAERGPGDAAAPRGDAGLEAAKRPPGLTSGAHE